LTGISKKGEINEQEFMNKINENISRRIGGKMSLPPSATQRESGQPASVAIRLITSQLPATPDSSAVTVPVQRQCQLRFSFLSTLAYPLVA
jgi:hypothetical protein